MIKIILLLINLNMLIICFGQDIVLNGKIARFKNGSAFIVCYH
jgi:hypothetical protein